MGKNVTVRRAAWWLLLSTACGASALWAASPPAQSLDATAAVRPLDQPQLPAGPGPSAHTITQWQDRKFGMFIHFGLYSVAGGMWNGKRVDNGYSEQIRANGPIPPQQYDALAKQFDPTHFDPDAIVALAKAAGMKFIVITAKHHDGFNLFHTAQTDYNVVDDTPYHQDIVKQLADACARGGLQFGVYYSTIDWHPPGGNRYIEGNGNPITPGQEAFNVAQLKELLGHYGPIAEIWFDMGKPTPAQSAHFARTVHDLQPQTMISGRVWNYQGDFAVMGDNAEPDVAMELPWQAPASMFPETWGYRSWQVRNDVQGKIRENITRLARVVSQGGNYILNIGPQGDGAVVPYEAQVLRGIGAWLKRNGEAIYGTRKQPFASLDFGYATVGAHALYLFVAKMPADHRLRVPGVGDTAFGRAYRLGASGAQAAVQREGSDISIALDQLPGWPAAATDAANADTFMPVLVLPFEGALQVRPASMAAAADGSFHLQPAQAERYLNYNGEGYEAPSTLYKLSWQLAAHAADYSLTVTYKPGPQTASMDLWVDGRRYPLQLDGTATQTVQIHRDRAAHPYAMQLELTPHAPFVQGTALPVTVDGVVLTPLH
ncbi:alpha-L-fucosidase [Dyella acidiphila]|uniref:alpha-L-fucosidase n=1 Tax=Dyella acidiphila TaxID=2775866 RepID=A0ABR9GA74_9GAMM|nr:alpha-L-fucosidase [Dyella acidiphila]MBE1160940.1 alpha-L-fucosidase [Dyella acidiphila]